MKSKQRGVGRRLQKPFEETRKALDNIFKQSLIKATLR